MTNQLLTRLCGEGEAHTKVGEDGRTYLARTEVERLSAERRRWLDRTAATRVLGISDEALDHLLSALLVVGEQRQVLGRDGFWIDRCSIDDLLASLVRPQLVVRGRGWLKPAVAVQMLSRGRFNVADLVTAVRDGRVRAGMVAYGARSLGALRVAREDVLALVFKARRTRERETGYSVHGVAKRLAVRASQVRFWIEKGYHGSRSGSIITSAELDAFRRTYGSCRDVARSLGIASVPIRKWIQQGEVTAISGPDIDGSRAFWVSRGDVLRCIDVVTVGRAAARFGVHAQTIRQLVLRGEVERVGEITHYGRLRVRLSQVARVLAERQRDSFDRVPLSRLGEKLGLDAAALFALLRDESVAWRPDSDGSPSVARASAEVLTRELARSEVAARLKVSVSVVRAWVRKGWLQPIAGTGRRWLSLL